MKTIEEFLSFLATLDIKLWVEGVSGGTQEAVRLRCNAPKGALTADIRTRLAEHKGEIIAFLQQGNVESNSTIGSISPVKRNADLPLSFAQSRLWFLDQLEGETATYNIPVTLRLVGSLHVTALEMALLEIVRRHEVLRTAFKIVNGSPVQVIAHDANLTMSVVDLQQLPEVEQSAEVQQLAALDFERPFSLSSGLLLRVTLLRLGEQSHVLLLTMHHIASDGWSMGIFIHELSTLYEAFSTGKPSPLAELLIQYADFAHWQRQWLSGEVLETQINYWRQQLAGAPPLLELPTDRPRPSVQTFQGSFEEFQLNQDLSQKLKTLSQQSGVTLFMTLLTAFAILLSKQSGQDDIVIGSLIANRNRSEVESLIGFFVNILVLRTQIQGNPTFLELLEHVRDVTLGAYAHQDLPFEKLVEELHPERSLSHAPLFQVMFILQNAPAGELELPGLTLTPLELGEVTARDDLLLSMEETEMGLTGGLVYKSDLFDAATITQMVENFQTLLCGIVANPQQKVSQLPLLSAAQKQQLLCEWNNTASETPEQHSCFPQLFEAQVARTPNAVAVVDQDQQLTYSELNARANSWAWQLVERGVGAETIVALMCDRNIDFLTGMLAVFKAGGAYLPLNPDHPPERIRVVLEQSQVPLVLAANHLSPMVTNAFNSLSTVPPQLLRIEDLAIPKFGVENLTGRCQPENLAYVIYTSGSTGTPKGAMLEHRGMVNHLLAKVKDLELSATDVIAQTASVSFDISIWQFLVALLVGGRVEIVSNQAATDPAQLLSLVETQKITILEIVPSLLRMMLSIVNSQQSIVNSQQSIVNSQQSIVNSQELRVNSQQSLVNGHHSPLPPLPPLPTPHSPLPPLQLRWLLLTGEALPPELCRQWFNYYPSIPMMNAYGPTECSDDVAHYPIIEPPATEVVNVPIGRPVLNTQLYILDKELQPVPMGVPGELYVGGVGVGRGYLNNPQLTPLAFIPDPFAKQAGTRLYKTGDKARYRRDGNIEFLGRIDYQVKIRGFRIELLEIEAVLLQHVGVVENVVIAREDTPGNQYLVAYVVANQQPGVTIGELRSYLKEKLPDYMVPSTFVLLESLPLTPNGKIDRRALPAPDLELSRASFVRPRDTLELQLAQIWEEVLGVQPVGVQDNFFDLGGHSLLAISLMTRIQHQFGKNLSLAALFQGATIEHLASLLRSSTVSPSWSTLVAIQPGGVKRPFFCVHPGVGTVLAYVDLARRLGPEQPFYGLESLGLDEEHKPYTQVEDMAAHYIKAMQTVQPQGPYLLGGWSFGGLVAFEMAQQLQAQGQQVSFLALLDTSAMALEELHEQDDTALLEDLVARDDSPVLGIPPELDPAQTQRLLQVFKSHLQAANSYRPQPYPGRVTLFLASEEGVATGSQDPTQGWGKLANEGVEIHWIPGNHNTMLSKPHVQVLTEKLRVCLGELGVRS